MYKLWISNDELCVPTAVIQDLVSLGIRGLWAVGWLWLHSFLLAEVSYDPEAYKGESTLSSAFQ
jgi:hypothetical protein